MELAFILEVAEVLRNFPRTGWLQRGIPVSECETVAEHTYEVISIIVAIAMLRRTDLSNEKMLLMGAIHDWPEGITSDIPRNYADKIGRGLKGRIELEIMSDLSSKAGVECLGKLFEEYLARETPESIVVKVADVLATLRVARQYSKRGYDVADLIESCEKELEEAIPRIHDKGLQHLLWSLGGAKRSQAP